MKNADFSTRFFCENSEIAAVQKYANLVELEKCCQTHIVLQNFVLIHPRASPPPKCKICKFCKILQNFANLMRPHRPPWKRCTGELVARTLAAAEVNPSDAAIHDCVTTLAKSERSAARRGCVFVSLRRKEGGIFPSPPL